MMDKAFKKVLSAALACCGFAFTAQADSISALGGDVTYAGAAEAKTLPDDGESVVFVQVDVTDEKGVRDPRAENRVSFAVAGPAKILAVGNGNARGLDSFKDVSSHPLYKGKAVVVLRRDKGAKETVTLTASADGLKEGKVAF